MNNSKAQLDITALKKAVNIYGVGEPTEEGVQMAAFLVLEQGESYAVAALEIVASGHTERNEG